ncbi:MAG: YegP family protein [Acidimicrobiales bacterium]
MPAEVFKRHDGKWAFRVKAANGQIVATDGDQGYENKADAVDTVTKLIRGDYDGPVSTP